MTSPPPGLPSLIVSMVLHRSPLPELLETLQGLRNAIAEAQRAGVLGPAEIRIVDNSLDEHYAAQAASVIDQALGDAKGYVHSFAVMQHNPGYGQSHNAVLLAHASDYCLVLNPDAVLDAAALSLGLRLLQANLNAVGLAPAATSGSGAPEYLCKRYPSVLVLFMRGFAPQWMQRWASHRIAHFELRDVVEAKMQADVPLISGCCMLLRGSALRDCGGFDPGFFMYFEDFDLSIRLRGRGRLIFAPAVKIRHYGGRTSSKGWRHIGWFLRSGIRFFNRHGWRWI